MTIIRRKTRAGKVRYGVRLEQGKRQLWVGTFDTIAEARQEEAKARLDRRGSRRMNCDRWAEFWLDGYRERVKDSSYDTASSALRGFIADFRGIPLERVDRVAAEKWARENRWRMPAVVTLLNAAVEAELLTRNPFAGLSRRTQGRRRNQPLTVSEIESLAAAAERHGLRPLILFLAYTGLRVGEAFALEWTDLDFEAMRIRVERRVYRGSLDLPKSNKPRLGVLTPPARDALMPAKTSGLVFTTKRGHRLSQTNMAWYWQSISAALPRKVTPHELRHFAAHHLYVTMGLPARVVAAQLGHDGPKLVEELYGHGEVGALEEIDRAFANVIPLRKVAGS